MPSTGWEPTIRSGSTWWRCEPWIAGFSSRVLRFPARGPAAAPDAQFTIEARFYEKLPYKKIKCKLCPRECVIDDRERGYCGVRENRGGTYYSLVYARVCAAHVDPIEKKPLFHFLPGTLAFSVATAGCNVNCKMCQNWDISQVAAGAGIGHVPSAGESGRARAPESMPLHRLHL